MTVYKFRGRRYNGEHYEYEVKYRAFAVAKDGCYLTASQFKTRAIK